MISGAIPLLAVELFTRNRARSAAENWRPSRSIVRPTITALAAILDGAHAPRFPPLLQLKPGTAGPPIFLAHGLGGTVMDFFQLVKHIHTQRPIYGMQAKGTDGVDEPFDRIEDLAQFHLDAIKELQPHGPYFLIGYSLGGLVTLEMAQRLDGNGREGWRCWLCWRVTRTRGFSRYDSACASVLDWPIIVRPTVGRLPLPRCACLHPPSRGTPSVCSRDGNGSALSQLPGGASHTPAMQHARESAYRSLTRYRPRFYNGDNKIREGRDRLCLSR